MGLSTFLKESRVKFTCPESKNQLRAVSISRLIKQNSNEQKLLDYIADKTPLFYRKFEDIVTSFKDGFFLSALYETLAKIPSSPHFQSSHFAEITSAIFVEEILGYRKIYSKLSLNTTENQNAYKMDLVCYIPGTTPIQFVFCEVKSSPKNAADGMPANHHTSCYADIFQSLRTYTDEDQKFDLTAIKDNLQISDETERANIRSALMPYSDMVVGYIGIAVIDNSTYDDSEIVVLGTRKSDKKIDVELLCVESYSEIATGVYAKLSSLKP